MWWSKKKIRAIKSKIFSNLPDGVEGKKDDLFLAVLLHAVPGVQPWATTDLFIKKYEIKLAIMHIKGKIILVSLLVDEYGN